MTSLFTMLAVLVLVAGMSMSATGQTIQSHAPIRPLPRPSDRPMADGPAYYVAPGGDDANPGTQDQPWRSINASLPKLKPGDTLYLRGGSYFEPVYCAIAGTPDKRITLRSYPGELVTIDGGFPEFQLDPANAWEPVSGGNPDEYVSTKSYKNIRDVVGLFGDSNVGLQTYWYLMDLRAENERWIRNTTTMIDPIYVGPGIFYDKQSGKIHARLAHTKLQLPTSPYKLVQYAGETDPRKLPLVIAPFQSKPLFVDQAMHVKFQDLVFRGGGYKTVDLLFGVDIEFDRCTIYAGTYGIWSKNTGPLKMTNSAVRGMIPPWGFRDENSLFAYTGSVYPPFVAENNVPATGGADPAAATQPARKITRHIARLPSHALLVTEGGFEFETFYYPTNHDWEVANCEFTDGHDGIYPSGRDIRFHHNWIDNMQDDAVYLSSPTPYVSDRIYFHDNLITTATIALGAHSRGGPGGDIYVYRNIIDMRNPVHFSRPTPEKPDGNLLRGSMPFLMHDSGNLLHEERMHFYHNTFLYPATQFYASFAGALTSAMEPKTPRRVFNNMFLFYGLEGKYPRPRFAKDQKADLQIDGNLYWHVDTAVPAEADFLKGLREDPIAEQNKEKYPPGLAANDISADPKLAKASSEINVTNDYRLQPGSAAIAAGVPLPQDYPDSHKGSAASPDIGAVPAGAEPLKVGIDGRITAGRVVEHPE